MDTASAAQNRTNPGQDLNGGGGGVVVSSAVTKLILVECSVADERGTGPGTN
jgi:hypothetical protein